MKRTIIILVLTLLLVPMLFGASSDAELKTRFSQTWAKTYGTNGTDKGRAVCQTSDGGYAITGKWASEWCIIKTDYLGNMLWRKSYSGSYGYSIQQTSDGGYITTGLSGVGGQLRLIKTNADGDVLWTKDYGGLEGNCVQQTADNGYIIAGTALPMDFWVIKTDTLGDTLWTRKFDRGQTDEANYVQQTTDGGYIVTGFSQHPETNKDSLWLIRLDSAGDTLWTKFPCTEKGHCVQQTTDGGYIIFGVTDPSNALLVKTDASGDLVWDNVYGCSWISCHSGQQTIDGGYICGTKKFASGNSDDFWLFKTDSLGNLLWSETYGGVSTDIGYDVKQTTDNGYIFVGYTKSFGAGGYDIMLVKTDSSGYAPMEPDITTLPSELVFDYSAKSTEYGGLHCPSVVKMSKPVIVPALAKKMKEVSNEELIPILITMSEQLDMDFLYEHACKLGKQDRRQWVISQARALVQRTQQSILSYLNTGKIEGKTDKIQSLWIINSISARVTKDVILELSLIPEIGQILFDDNCFHALGKPSGGTVDGFLRGIVWNVDKVRADSVWIRLGHTGEGIIIGHIDTGVNYNHTDLADHMWDGGAIYPHHGWDFVNDDNDPMDDNGHGTHTAGTAAGDGTSGTQTGVAPDAQIMALKVLDASGSGYLGDLALSVQFCIFHGVDVISMSLGFENPDDGTKNWCRAMCVYAIIADLPMALAAGNGITGSPGSHYPIPHDIYTPGDVPAPWYGSSV
ncbi:MAG: S8 family serine peptidase, partial [bacterium]